MENPVRWFPDKGLPYIPLWWNSLIPLGIFLNRFCWVLGKRRDAFKHDKSSKRGINWRTPRFVTPSWWNIYRPWRALWFTPKLCLNVDFCARDCRIFGWIKFCVGVGENPHIDKTENWFCQVWCADGFSKYACKSRYLSLILFLICKKRRAEALIGEYEPGDGTVFSKSGKADGFSHACPKSYRPYIELSSRS